MAFDKNLFEDGESAYQVPYWRQVIETIDAEVDTFDYVKEARKRQKVREDEVGIKHPKNNSHIIIKDDGTIEAFAGNGTGIRIKPDESMQIFGNTQIIGNKFQGITGVNDTEFNGEKLSGEYPSLEEKGKSESLKDLMREMDGDK